METALSQQIARNRQLEESLQVLRTSASPFVEFVQDKYDRLRVQYEEEVQRFDAFREEVADRLNQTAEIAHLKSEFLKMIRTRHVAQEKFDREIAGVRKQMDETGDRLVAECEAQSD
ncbi:unnamed protein product [Peronospora destructor]|uniref:Uncharacterized protein n=1 Tax=Peronospora destructor TaxID=86335 RepID=A0AAV0VEN5_9STRA|nr:unnamed protein product [Peronospora destructor]